jgi:hypothetical protein
VSEGQLVERAFALERARITRHARFSDPPSLEAGSRAKRAQARKQAVLRLQIFPYSLSKNDGSRLLLELMQNLASSPFESHEIMKRLAGFSELAPFIRHLDQVVSHQKSISNPP